MKLRGLRCAAAVAAMVVHVVPLNAAELSPTEQKIVAAIKARSAAALQFLERSVNVNSGTMNHDGVREVGRMFRAEFDQLGFATRWAEMPPAMQRAGHLIATREGRQGKRLLLIGHLDTVFEKDSPVQPWDRKGDRVRGQGVSDMKGGDVIIIEALRALQAAGALDHTTISVVFSGDEERVGHPIEMARADLINAAVVLGGTEVTYDDIATRGTAYGKSNIIARTATVKGDLRYLTGEQRDRTHRRMREIVAASLPGTSAKIAFHEAYPPMSPTPGNLRVLQMYSQASSDAGLGAISPLPPGERGAGDVQFVAPLLDSLDGIGASGRGAHSPDEDLEPASIERAAIRAAMVIYRLTR